MSSIFIIEYGGPTTEILFDLEKTALDLRMYLAEIARLPMSRISLFFPAGVFLFTFSFTFLVSNISYQ